MRVSNPQTPRERDVASLVNHLEELIRKVIADVVTYPESGCYLDVEKAKDDLANVLITRVLYE